MFRSNHLRAAGQSAQCPLPFAVDQQHDTLRGLGRRAGSRICGINYKAPPQLVRVDLKGHLGGFADSRSTSFANPDGLNGAPLSETNNAAAYQRLIFSMVRPRGLEPPRVAPLAPQASASTNSATAAWGKDEV